MIVAHHAAWRLGSVSVRMILLLIFPLNSYQSKIPTQQPDWTQDQTKQRIQPSIRCMMEGVGQLNTCNKITLYSGYLS